MNNITAINRLVRTLEINAGTPEAADIFEFEDGKVITVTAKEVKVTYKQK